MKHKSIESCHNDCGCGSTYTPSSLVALAIILSGVIVICALIWFTYYVIG